MAHMCVHVCVCVRENDLAAEIAKLFCSRRTIKQNGYSYRNNSAFALLYMEIRFYMISEHQKNM